MLYRPNFCCECGEKIERHEWKIWTTRRFCEICETKHRSHDLVPKLIAGFCLLLGVFGFGSFLQSKPADNAPAVKASLVSKPVSAANTTIRATDNVPDQSQIIQRNANSVISTPERLAKTDKNQGAHDADDAAVYYCGAATKKGTPCSRKVRGNVRCWQHTGMPAMLPAEKLLANR